MKSHWEELRAFQCPLILGQQADVLGEHGEEAALEESGDDLRVVAVGFEGLGEPGEASGDVAGDLGGALAGIERVGIGEDQAQALADFRAAEIGEEDAVVPRRPWPSLDNCSGGL